MELELKHLAPYFPYGLNILYWNGTAKKYIGTLQVLHYETRHVLGSDKHKPILRPLSDLTKEITVNGETFVPTYRLIKEDKSFTKDFIDVFGYEELKVSVYELLLEWHFDIFRLIPAGLAIDINTLNE